MQHRVRKASLVNPLFSDEEFNTLQSVDAQIGAACLGLKEAADVLAAGLKVSSEIRKGYLAKAPLSLNMA